MTDRLLFSREEDGAAPAAVLTSAPIGTPLPSGGPRLPIQGEDEVPLPEDVIQAAKEAAEQAEATAVPAPSQIPARTKAPAETEEASETEAPAGTEASAETEVPAESEAPAETVEMTALPAPSPEETPEGQTGAWGALASPWLSIALGVCALGLLAGNIAQFLRRRKKLPPPGVSVGRVHAQGARQYQQDCLAVSDPAALGRQGLLAVVADGMGGLSDGEKLSAAAVEAALGAFAASIGTEPPEQLLLTLAKRSTQAVNRVLGPDNYRKGGTTLLLGLIRGGRFYWLTVGDSHIYLLRSGGLVLLNREHVYANELALRSVNGEMSAAEACSNSEGGGLVSYLGMGALKYADIPAEPVEIVPGDKFILMSDGVYNALEPGEMRTLLDGPAETAAARLGQAIAAKGYPNQDNYTAVILECGPEA